MKTFVLEEWNIADVLGGIGKHAIASKPSPFGALFSVRGIFGDPQ